MKEEKRFYVYVHRYASGPKEGQVFYVGKGSGDRCDNVYGRNIHWNRVVSKYGFKPEKIVSFSREECAFSIEAAIIKLYGIGSLTNMTIGGGGISGYVFPEESRRKIAVSNSKKRLVCSNGMVFELVSDAIEWLKSIGKKSPTQKE